MSTPTLAPALAPEQIGRYHAEGYLMLRNVFGEDEVAALASECETLLGRGDLIDTANIRCRWSDHRESGACLFDCFDPVIDIGPVCRYLARDARILSAVSCLYGEPAHLLKDKLIFKRPGVKGYGLHQDYISWPEFPQSFVTAILAIDSTDAENGATEVFAGYHRQGCLSPSDGNYHELSPDAVAPEHGVILDLEPGDLAIFSGFTPHRSAANASNRWRRQLYLSYNAHSDGADQRDAHYREFHNWLKQKYAEYGRTNVYFR